MAIATDERQVVKISVGSIAPNPYQPRKRFDEGLLKELAASLQEHGLMQPIMVRSLETGASAYELVIGERRLRAAKLAGFETIDSIVREDMTAEEAREVALIENLQRKDLTPMEEANSLAGLLEQYDGSYAHVAERVSKSEVHVRSRVALMTLPQIVQEMLENERLNIGQAIAITQIEGEKAQIDAAKKAARLRLNPNQIKGSMQSNQHHAGTNGTGATITLKNLSKGLTYIVDGLESFDHQNLRDKAKRGDLQRQMSMAKDVLATALMMWFQEE